MTNGEVESLLRGAYLAAKVCNQKITVCSTESGERLEVLKQSDAVELLGDQAKQFPYTWVIYDAKPILNVPDILKVRNIDAFLVPK